MLTESERAWLKRRQFFNGFYSSGCLTCSLNRTFCDKTNCPLHPDLDDALEFEARVAAKLAERCVLLEKVVQKTLGVAEYINLSAAAENTLKAARLQVEEEMDGR